MALDLDSLNTNKKSVIRFSEKKEKTLAPFERAEEPKIKERTPSLLSMEDLNRFDDEESFLDFSNVTDEIRENGPLPTMGEKTKPPTILEKAEVADKKWAKVESKTEKILKVNTEKTRRRRVEDIRCTQGIQKINSVSFQENPSRLDYTALRGDNKVMLNLIIEHVTDEAPYWIVGTEELTRKCSMNESTLKTVIQRLKKKGFINVKRGVGERLFTVNPTILSF